MENKYDSRADTLAHIRTVNERLIEFSQELLRRGVIHDQSKLEDPEKQWFDEFTPKLREMKYGSEEYKQSLKNLGTCLKFHYAENSHHPEHYSNGINGMDLFDLVEMFADWCAAVERHDDGDILQSIEKNKERFSMSDQLAKIFENTVVRWKGRDLKYLRF